MRSQKPKKEPLRAKMARLKIGLWPACLNCNEAMRPNFKWIDRRIDEPDGGYRTVFEETDQLIGWGYQSCNAFCSLRCGFAYGLAASGVRRKA